MLEHQQSMSNGAGRINQLRIPWAGCGLSRSARVSPAERFIRELLEMVDVRIAGDRPWDLQVHSPGFFDRVLAGGSLALGESYMEGVWDCEQLDQFFHRVLSGRLENKLRTSARAFWSAARAMAVNLQKGRRAFTVGRRHYDLGEEIFTAMLDRRMTYSCGYWKKAATLDEAQEAKLDLICRKIGLRAGQSVLDIGCGWGSFAGFAAERYGARIVGVTVSRNQARYAQKLYAHLPVEIHLRDYRDIRETFDHVVSVGMFEHVGCKNYRTYMETVARCLSPEGCFLLHTIGRNRSGVNFDPWIEKYIFPNSMLPSARQITDAAEGLFVLRDWHAFGEYYDPTLMAWHANCERSWETGALALEKRFQRMWRYYLLVSAGSFRSDHNQLWQVLFSKIGCRRAETAVR